MFLASLPTSPQGSFDLCHALTHPLSHISTVSAAIGLIYIVVKIGPNKCRYLHCGLFGIGVIHRYERNDEELFWKNTRIFQITFPVVYMQPLFCHKCIASIAEWVQLEYKVTVISTNGTRHVFLAQGFDRGATG